MRPLFVVVHQPGIASHVSGQYCRQPALNPDWPLFHHGTNPPTASGTRSEGSAERVLTGFPSQVMSVVGTTRTNRAD